MYKQILLSHNIFHYFSINKSDMIFSHIDLRDTVIHVWLLKTYGQSDIDKPRQCLHFSVRKWLLAEMITFSDMSGCFNLIFGHSYKIHFFWIFKLSDIRKKNLFELFENFVISIHPSKNWIHTDGCLSAN